MPNAKNDAVEILMKTTSNALIGLKTDENYLVLLNESNSVEVERLILEDSSYHFDETKNKFLSIWKRKNHRLNQDDWFNVVKAIATENSTRSSDVNMRYFAEFMDNEENDFLGKLEIGDLELVDKMLNYVTDKNNNRRKDKSLASKICKYLNEWIFNSTSYSINDSFVRKVIPYYLKKWEIPWPLGRKKNLDDASYVQFMSLITALEEKVPNLNKHQIDHILWYCYRSDPIRLEVAIALGK